MDVALSDADLVPAIAAGNQEAEAELCRRMWPRIRLYGLRHLRSPAAADDLAQQVLMTALESLRAGRLREPGKVAAFVLGISRMTILDQRRGTRRREQLLEMFGTALTPPAAASEPAVDGARLARCLQALKERDRSAIVLTYCDERRGPETARFLGVSEANLRVIKHRALHQLRVCMGAGA